MLSAKILVIDATFMPVGVVTTKQAMVMLYREAAKVLDNDYNKYTIDEWLLFEPKENEDFIGLSHGRKLKIPRIVILNKIHASKYNSKIKVSKNNIFLRDKYVCQYCGAKKGKHRLNIDHVIPRSQGGKTQWNNVVTSCIYCNSIKGPRTPEQAKLPLLTVPKKPNWILPHGVLTNIKIYDEWQPFLQHLNLDILNIKDEE